MPQVVVEINGRTYTLECGAGQEERLRALARTVDDELAQIREMTGPVGELRLLIMTALLLADRADELQQKLDEISRELQELRENSGAALDTKAATTLMEQLEQATGRLKKLSLKAVE